MRDLLDRQGVRIIAGVGRLSDPHTVVAETAEGSEEIEADAILLGTGSSPRVPDFAPVDGERVMTTRDAYPPPVMPEHLVVIGSGVTGVEFVHMFSSLGAEVTLLVSRQQVLPNKDPEVAAALEENFLDRGVHLLKGARATGIAVDGDLVQRRCVRTVGSSTGSHTPCWPSVRCRTRRCWASRRPVSTAIGATCRSIATCGRTSRTSTPPATCRASCPLSSVAVDAGSQDRRPRDGAAHPRPPSPRLREGGVGHLHRARDRRRRPGRGRRLRRGPQGQGHQGAVLGQREGA